MKRLLLLLALLLVGMLNVNQAEAGKIVKGNFQYKYESTKGGIWITKITPRSDKGIATLKIPTKINGKKVVKLGGPKDTMNSDWQDYGDGENIFGVNFAPDDCNYDYTPMVIYERTKKIKKIQIPSTVEKITWNCFSIIQDGKIINIPKGVKKNISNFSEYRWKKFTISPKNKTYKEIAGCLLSKDGKILYGFVESRKKVVIPKTVKTIKRFRANYDGVSTIVIPKGVTRIEDEGLRIRNNVTIKVAKGNEKYAVKNGCLYNKKTGRLVAGSAKNGVLKIPKEVTTAVFYYGFLGPSPNKVIVPSEVKEIADLLDITYEKNLICVMKGKKPPKLVDSQIGNVKSLTVYVPKGCKDVYEEEWGKHFYSSLTVTYIEQE